MKRYERQREREYIDDDDREKTEQRREERDEILLTATGSTFALTIARVLIGTANEPKKIDASIA